MIDSKAVSNSLSNFPGKSFFRVTGKSLERRKQSLELWLVRLCSGGGYGVANIVDSISSFLETPDQWSRLAGGGVHEYTAAAPVSETQDITNRIVKVSAVSSASSASTTVSSVSTTHQA